MSSGLMSCVRENSPPLEMDANESGALSLPVSTMTAATLAPNSPGAKSANCDGTGAGAPPTAEQQKRRRFHPLRNLRRIFRRRTITSVADSPAANSNPPTSTASEKNLRSATLSSISSVVSASSPSSPLTHQQLQEAYSGSQSLPKAKAKAGSNKAQRNALLATGHPQPKTHSNPKQQQHQHHSRNNNSKQPHNDADVMYSSATTATATSVATSYHRHHAYMASSTPSAATDAAELPPRSTVGPHRQSMGVAVLPGAFNAAMSRSFYAERQKLKSVGDSSQDLDSANSSLSSSRRGTGNECSNAGHASGNGSGGEMTDSQRSLSEGRLVDSDYSRDGLSQSHDSVFSESATASSLSIVLKAELADVLRKRRNRPDASDEDLGLPRSPASPQRRAERNAAANATTPTTAGNQSEVSSLSLLSMNSTEGEDFASSTANSSTLTDQTSSAMLQERTFSTITASRYSRVSAISLSSDILRSSGNKSDGAGKNETHDEIDLFSSDWQRLSHSAAKHKMAVRPTKKKGPSRQHRRTLETSIPESNEEHSKTGCGHLLDLIDKDAKSKTRSLPPGVNAKILEQHAEEKLISTATVTTNDPTTEQQSFTNIKRSKTEKVTTSSMSLSASNTSSSSTKPTASTSNSSFGLRALSAKASSIFESKPESMTTLSSNVTDEQKDVQAMETSESGFLRRLIQRNSKRTISKANGNDELDLNQSEPKKLQISSSVYEQRHSAMLPPSLDKSKSAVAYEQKVEETRKEIKREIMSEGKTGLSAMLNTFMFAPSISSETSKASLNSKEASQHATATHQKPKSGPAARQRYLPQEINPTNTLEKPARTPTKSVPTESFGTSTFLSKTSNEETFQSTSIIREITASQAATNNGKSEHHFEKKPKIIGLSAFQQKISRSNDSFTRSSSNNTSTNSLETSGDAVFLNYEQKERKSVEKSRSFRTYIEQKDASVHNNMPSLPDLSLNLRLPNFGEFILNEKEYSSPSPPDPNEKSMSLGFEINDNNLVRPTPRAESISSLSPLNIGSTYHKNVVLTTKSRPTTLLPPTAMMPSISPTNSCSNDISEIEQNIDLIVKSPFVSVLRKSATISDEMAAKLTTAVGSHHRKLEDSGPKSYIDYERLHSPKVLSTQVSKFSEEKLSPRSPAISVVPMREKSHVATAAKTSAETIQKDSERKSIATANPATSKTNSFNRTRRSSSAVESSSEPPNAGVPEFMKIQLNRVDPCTRAAKSTVVLAKNVKESSPISQDAKERCSSIDDLSFRRCSNESVEITESDTPDTEKIVAGLFEAINKQTKSVSTSSIRGYNSSELPPKSPVKKSPAATTPTNTPMTTPVTTPSTADAEEPVILRHKPPKPTDALAANKLSLQERKRLFMSEEKAKMDKKIEELKNERKKCITEEVFRKSLIKTEDKDTTPPPALESLEKDNVVLRKKSFGVAHQSNSLNGNGGSSSTTTTSANNNNNSGTNRDDSTPELMKVFARRSLKIKDEDLVHLADKILPAHTAPLKKFTPSHTQQNVDSDKENQSSSEEKLDKLPKFEVAIEQVNSVHKVATSVSSNTAASNSNRNSLADFRNSVANKTGVSNGLSLSSSHNNSNNNNNNVTAATTLPSKGYLPNRVAGFRAVSIERNGSANKQYTPSSESMNNANNNNNHSHNNFNSSSKTSLERQSLSIRATTATTTESGNGIVGSKTIERSATVGEFKGIHQRRAEWEQRAKEALK